MKEIRKKLTYANVMSSLAVFLVLGGATAVAAIHLGKNSVGTAQLKSSAVTGGKIQNGAISGAKVQDGALSGTKVQDSSLTGNDISNGSVTGGDISNGSVTGDDIDIKTLGPVPTANTLAGQTHFSFTSKGTVNVRDLIEPFELEAICTDGSVRRAELRLDSAAGPIEVASSQGPISTPATLLSVTGAPVEPGGPPTGLKTSEEQFIAVVQVAQDEPVVKILIKDLAVAVNAGGTLNEECSFAGTVETLQ